MNLSLRVARGVMRALTGLWTNRARRRRMRHAENVGCPWGPRTRRAL